MQIMSGDGLSIPSSIRGFAQEPNFHPNPNTNTHPVLKKRRNLPGTPDPNAEVIALSPKTLMTTNRFVCEICNKGFQRDQNLQLHRRGHNLPWKLRQRTSQEIQKRVYICPEKNCVHHDPSRALGDLTGIKKHFSRKHCEKKWKCEKCSKKYAVQSDWKAHSKTCGTREYKCDCGTLFSRKDSFITHRAFCDALAKESARLTSATKTDSMNEATLNPQLSSLPHGFSGQRGEDASGIPQFCPIFRPGFVGSDSNPLSADKQKARLSLWLDKVNSHLNPVDVEANSNAYLASSSMGFPELVQMPSANIFGSSSSMVDYWSCIESQWLNRCTGASANANLSLSMSQSGLMEGGNNGHMMESLTSLYSNNQNQQPNPAHMSATALLQKASHMESTRSNPLFLDGGFGVLSSSSGTTGLHPHTQIRNEFHHVFQQAKQPENLSELMNSISSTTTTGPVRDGMLCGLKLSSLTDRANNLSNLMMPPNVKQGQSVPLKLHASAIKNEHSLTRDFLGVGEDSGHPFLQQELAKFASMDSTMGLNQYNGNH